MIQDQISYSWLHKTNQCRVTGKYLNNKQKKQFYVFWGGIISKPMETKLP